MTEPIRFVRCHRCQLSLRVSVKTGNPQARLMRYADDGESLCASCAATLFLHSVPPIKQAIDQKREMLLWEAMKRNLRRLCKPATQMPGQRRSTGNMP